MSQKLKSTAPWLILPAVVLAIAVLGLLPPAPSAIADTQQTPVDENGNPLNPTPKECCKCFEMEISQANAATDANDPDKNRAETSRNGKLTALSDNDEIELIISVTKNELLHTNGQDKCAGAQAEIRITGKDGFIPEQTIRGVDASASYPVTLDASKGPFTIGLHCETESEACTTITVETSGCDSCCGSDSGSGPTPPSAESGSAKITFPLGSAKSGDVSGIALIYHEEVITNPGVSAIRLRAPHGNSVTVTKDPQGNIATVKTGNIHAAVVSTPTATDPNAFEIRKSTDLTNPVTAANAFRTTRIENTAADKLLVTTTFNGATTRTEYTYIQATDTWTRVEGITAATPNGLRKEDLTITDDGSTRTERRTVTDIPASEVTSDTLTTYTYFPWGREMTSRVNDPDGAALTTTWDYYEPGEPTGLNGGVHGYGRLETLIRHDGYEETHLYDLNKHTTFRPYAGQNGALVETRSYHPQTKTLTVTRQVGSNMLSKTVTIEQSPTVTVERIYTDATNFLETTTEYYPAGQDFGGQVKKITRPDGTVTIHEYTRNGNTKTTTTYNGVPGGANITEGTKTVTITNQSGKTISSITTAVGTGGGTTLAHSLATAEDDFGRPTAMGYFPDGNGGYAYTTSRTFGCCGVVTDTDRTGITTHYAYDALRRQIKVNRLGITTETRRLGLTTSTYRYPEAGTTAEVGNPAGVAANEVSRSYRSLSGTLARQWSRTAKDGTLVMSSETARTYLNPAHTAPATLPAGIGMSTLTKALQTADDASRPTQTTETYLDGKTYQTYGDLSPAVRTTYAVGATGMESTRSFVDGANLRESVTTRSDLAGRGIATIYADGSTATASYNALGQMDSSSDPDGVTTFYEYNAEGQRILTILDLNGNDAKDPGIDQYTLATTNPGSYSGNDVITTATTVFQDGATYPAGGTIASRSHRSTDGLRSWSVSLPALANPENRTTSSVTTLMGGGNFTVKAIAPDDSYTLQTTTGGLAAKTESFDAADTLIAATTYTTYDSHNRPTHVTDSRTGTSVTAYVSAVTDAVASLTDPAGNTTAFTYDLRSRRTTTDAPDTDIVDTATGNIVSSDNITTTRYFAHGQTKEVVGAQTYRRTYTYDYAHRMKTLTTYGSQTATTEWIYDTTRGFLTEKNYHGETGNGPGNTADYTYTAAGRLATRTWERGVTTTQHYDPAGRLTKTTYSDAVTPQVDYIHDRLSRPRFAIQGSQINGSTVNVTEYTYRTDNLTLDKEITVEGAYDAGATTTQYTSSQTFKRTLERSVDALLRPGGYDLKDGPTSEHAVSYGYKTGDSRLLSVTAHGQTHTYGYQYSQANATAPRVGDTSGTRQDFTAYTVASPAHSVTNTHEANRNVLTTKENSVPSVPSVVSKYTYSTNAIGQRESLTRSGTAPGAGTTAWTYNAAGEVTSADDSDNTRDRAYQFDGIGNRQKSADSLTLPGTDNYTANAQNQYTSVPSLPSVLSYDQDGNATAYPLPVAPSVNSTLTWDAENRLISVTVNGTTTDYRYDHQHRRISKQIDTTPAIHYLYDGWNMIADYTTQNSTLKIQHSYTWGMDLSGSMQGAGGVGGLLSVTEHTGAVKTHYYPTFDGNGNVSEYLDALGVVQASYQYDAFGRTVASTGLKKDDFAHRFSTKYLDQETGLYYYGYRYYDPVTGRWPSRDPLGEEGGLNLYGFVNNNAIAYYDKYGLFPWGRVLNGLGGAAQIAAGIAAIGTANPAGIFLGVVLVTQGIGNIAAAVTPDEYNVTKEIAKEGMKSVGIDPATGEKIYIAGEIVTGVVSIAQGAKQCASIMIRARRTVTLTTKTIKLTPITGRPVVEAVKLTRTVKTSVAIRASVGGQVVHDFYQLFRSSKQWYEPAPGGGGPGVGGPDAEFHWDPNWRDRETK